MIINLTKRNVELSAVTGLLPHHLLEKKGFSVTKHPFWGYTAIFGNHMGIGCHQEPRSQIGYVWVKSLDIPIIRRCMPKKTQQNVWFHWAGKNHPYPCLKKILQSGAASRREVSWLAQLAEIVEFARDISAPKTDGCTKIPWYKIFT